MIGKKSRAQTTEKASAADGAKTLENFWKMMSEHAEKLDPETTVRKFAYLNSKAGHMGWAFSVLLVPVFIGVASFIGGTAGWIVGIYGVLGIPITARALKLLYAAFLRWIMIKQLKLDADYRTAWSDFLKTQDKSSKAG